MAKPAAASERYALAWTVDDKPREENILWYDLNGDGIVDEQDLAILMSNLSAEREVVAGLSHRRRHGDGTIDDSTMPRR